MQQDLYPSQGGKLTSTAEYTIAFSAGASACMYIYRQVLTLQQGRKNGNGSAGMQPVSFWTSRFDKLDALGERQTEILEKQTGLMQEQVKLLTVIADRQNRKRYSD